MTREEQGKGRGSRWSESEARRVLGKLEKSGLSVNRFAAERGLGRERLYKWRRRLARTKTPAPRATGFAEVAVTPRAAIEIAWPGGMALRFAGPTRLEDVRAVLQDLLGH